LGIKITVISVGKIKDKYLVLGIDEFNKRLKRFCKMEYIELKDEAISDKASEKELENIKSKEGKRIIEKINKDSYVFLMDLHGKQLTSEKFSAIINQVTLQGKSHITFIIGGSLGLSEEVRQQAHFKLSFSEMTFPHQMFKLMLLEQLYRQFKITANESYHK